MENIIKVKEFILHRHGPTSTGIYVSFASLKKHQPKEEHDKQIDVPIENQTEHLEEKKWEPFLEEDSSKNIEYRFESISLRFYMASTAIFSAIIRVKSTNGEMLEIDNEEFMRNVEEATDNIIKEKFDQKIKDEVEKFRKLSTYSRVEVLTRETENIDYSFINFGEAKVNESRWECFDCGAKFDDVKQHQEETDHHNIGKRRPIAWWHTLFWFWGGEYTQEKAQNIADNFISILKQKPKNMETIPDRYIFFGSGRSLILTKNEGTELSFQLRPEFSEIEMLMGKLQYFWFATYLINNFLTVMLYSKTKNGKLGQIEKELEYMDEIEDASLTFLDSFQNTYGITWLPSGIPLVDKLYEFWKMPELVDGVQRKIEIVKSRLESKRDATLKHREKSLNKAVLIFTFIALSGFITEFIGTEIIDDANLMLPYVEPVTDTILSPIWLVVLFALAILGVLILTGMWPQRRIR